MAVRSHLKHQHDGDLHEALSHYPPAFELNRDLARTHPRHKTFAKYFDLYMILIAFLAATFAYLQAAIIIGNKSSENVSVPSYIILVIVTLSWMAYGVLWTDSVLSLSGAVASVGSIIALVAALSYRPSTTPGAFTVT